jgi:hypothetical protein
VYRVVKGLVWNAAIFRDVCAHRMKRLNDIMVVPQADGRGLVSSTATA